MILNFSLQNLDPNSKSIRLNIRLNDLELENCVIISKPINLQYSIVLKQINILKLTNLNNHDFFKPSVVLSELYCKTVDTTTNFIQKTNIYKMVKHDDPGIDSAPNGLDINYRPLSKNFCYQFVNKQRLVILKLDSDYEFTMI